MRVFASGLWLLCMIGLAVALAMLSAGLQQEILHCVGQEGWLKLTPAEAAATYPLPDLQSALSKVKLLDLITFLVALLAFSVLVLRLRGVRQWVAVLGTLLFVAAGAWGIVRENAGKCSLVDEVEVISYIFPAMLCLMLLWRLAELFARKLEP